MRRIFLAIGLLSFIIGAAVAALTPDASPPDSPPVVEVDLGDIQQIHTIPPGTPQPHDWCLWQKAANGLDPYLYIQHSRFIHYGSAHIYQCWMRSYASPPPGSGFTLYGWRENWCFWETEWYGFQGEDLFYGDPYYSHDNNAGTPCW